MAIQRLLAKFFKKIVILFGNKNFSLYVCMNNRTQHHAAIDLYRSAERQALWSASNRHNRARC